MPAHPSPTRRTLLGVVAAGLLATTTGCEWEVPGRDPDAGDSRSDDPDVLLLGSVREAVTAAAALVAATSAAHPGQGATLSGLGDMHAAHLTALGEPLAPPGPQTPQPPPSSGEPTPRQAPIVPEAPADALRRVVTQEQALLADLSQAALVAESGQFARLLASMSAGLLQHLTPLEEPA